MNDEFHYYITYLVAARAGYAPTEAATVAHACQLVDDNNQKYCVAVGTAQAYTNYYSQTMDILKPLAYRQRIYSVFHFLPGDPLEAGARRRDGKMHWLVATPGGSLAQTLLDGAISSKDLYRLGIACHAYADTWAHQNFVGYKDGFNSMRGMLEEIIPDIGHADAKHAPDWPAAQWTDGRNLSSPAVDNKGRFLSAADAIFAAISPQRRPPATGEGTKTLRDDLDWAIGERDDSNTLRDARVGRYKMLAMRPEYGATAIPDYSPKAWFGEAVRDALPFLPPRVPTPMGSVALFPKRYGWRDAQNYRQKHWFKFQEAVKAHQAATMEQMQLAIGDKMFLEKF